MATEIEHKYKVLSDSYLTGYTSAQYFRQGYLTVEKDCVVRVRIAGKKAYLTIKGKNRGCSRVEYELPIDLMTAQSMLDNLCHTPIIEKTRYIYFYAGHNNKVAENIRRRINRVGNKGCGVPQNACRKFGRRKQHVQRNAFFDGIKREALVIMVLHVGSP